MLEIVVCPLLSPHSLGTLGGAYLVANGLAPSNTAYALPFGHIAPVGTSLTIGAFDVVNGGFLGAIFNPGATVVTGGTYKHVLGTYPNL